MKLPRFDVKKRTFEEEIPKQEFDFEGNQMESMDDQTMDFGGFDNTQSKQDLLNFTQFPESFSQSGPGIFEYIFIFYIRFKYEWINEYI